MDRERSDDEGEDEDSDEEAEGNGGFAKKWIWIYYVDKVSEAMRIDWPSVFKLGVYEFLNVMSYVKDKADWEQQEAEKYKKKH